MTKKRKCEICNQEFTTNATWSRHIIHKHNVSAKDYYDKYLKQDSKEGKCVICGNPTKFQSIGTGYSAHCSRKCANKNPTVREKIKQTNLEKFGVPFPNQSKEIQEKTKRTNLRRYGVDNPAKNKEIQEKIRNTNLEKYGTTCVLQNSKIQEKIKTTMLEQYGVENPSQSEKIKAKKRATTLKNFGVEYPGQSKVVQSKMRETNLERYGVENPSQSSIIKEKKKKTFLKHYGVEHNFQAEEVKEQIKQTNLKLYGAENPSQSNIIKEKKKETTLKNWGVENPFQSETIKEQIKENNIEKYGVPYTSQLPEVQEKIRQTSLENYGVQNLWQKHITNYKDWLNLEQFLMEHTQEFTCIELANYFSIHYQTVRNIVRKNKLEHLVKDFYTLSEPEQAFAQELDKLNIDYDLHNRSIIFPLEVDFYLPKYKLAIEVSPAFTHQYVGEELSNEKLYYGVTDPEYHYNKFKLCKEQGVELITIFDWIDQAKVLDFIQSKIEPTQTVYARKTKTKLVKGLTKEHKEFLERNHILGSINNSKTTEVVELYYDSKIIGLAVFEQKKNYIELRRLAFEQGYHIPGGASKLIKAFTREHPELKELITFSDNDLGTGNVYKKLGFQTLEENKGTLIWYNYKHDKKIPNLSLVKQGTDRLLKNFPGYEYVGQGDDLPSNQEIIQQYGFVPVYDCGYTKWALAL